MNFESRAKEKIFISTISCNQSHSFEKDIKNGLTIVWNLGEDARFMVDNQEVIVEKD